MKKVLCACLALAFLMTSASVFGVWAADEDQTANILQLTPTASWTLDGGSGLYYANDSLGGANGNSWCSFSADFGTAGYDIIGLSVASASGTSVAFDIYVDDTLQTNMVRVATGSWTESQDGETVLDQTYTGTHTVKIAWKDNGNLFGVYLKNLNDVSTVTVTPSAQWEKSDLTYNTSGNFGGATGISWCSFSMNFGGEGFDTIGLSVASALGDSVGFEISIDGTLQNNKVSVPTGSWETPQTGTAALNQTYTGVHTVKIAWKDNGNLFGVVFNRTVVDTTSLKLIPQSSWTLDGTSTLNYNSSGYLGGGQNISWCSFSADFGTEGYNQLALSVASGSTEVTTVGFGVYIDGDLQDNSVNVATGSWTEPQSDTVSLNQTYTGTHTIKIVWKYSGNLYSVTLSKSEPADDVTHNASAVLTPDSSWLIHPNGTSQVNLDGSAIVDTSKYDAITIPNVVFDKAYACVELKIALNSSVTEGDIDLTIGGICDEVIATFATDASQATNGTLTVSADLKYLLSGTHDITLLLNEAYGDIYSLEFKGTADSTLEGLSASYYDRVVIKPSDSWALSENDTTVTTSTLAFANDGGWALFNNGYHIGGAVNYSQMKFTVDFGETGSNFLGLYACQKIGSDNDCYIYIDDDTTGTRITVPDTGAWDSPVALMNYAGTIYTGTHTVKIVTGGSVNIYGLLWGYDQNGADMYSNQIEAEVTDASTGLVLKGYGLNNKNLVVDTVTSGDVYNTFVSSLEEDGYQLVSVYKLDVQKNGTSITPLESGYRLGLPTDGKEEYLMYSYSNGKVSEVGAVMNTGKLTAMIYEFGYFAVVSESGGATTDNTSTTKSTGTTSKTSITAQTPNTGIKVSGGLILLAFASGVLTVVTKKRKEIK